MKYFFLISAFILGILSFSSFGEEEDHNIFKFDINSEGGTQTLRENSPINPSNSLRLNEVAMFTRAGIQVENSSLPNTKGMLKLEGIYAPTSFTRTDLTGPSRQNTVYLKAGYIDLLQEGFTLRIGKQFINWGSGIFFSPLDIINHHRDPLRPLDEAEGNSFWRLSVPILSSGVSELYVVYPVDQGTQNEIKKKDMFIVPKIGSSMGAFSWWAMAKLQTSKRAQWGGNLSYAFSPMQYVDTTLFAEGIIRNERTKYNIDSQKKTVGDFSAYLIGLQNRYSLSTCTFLDGINFDFEFYTDKNNWSNKEMILFEENIRNGLLTSPQARLLFVPFTNSQKYFFAHLGLENFIFRHVKMGGSFIYNENDQSYLTYAEINYIFGKQNGQLGFKYNVFTGRAKSEMGDYPIKNVSQLSLSLSF